jgi:hemolysin activation/secretion protein
MIASLSLQSSVSSLFWDVGKNLSGLGRANPSENWAIVQAGFYGSFFLEPVLLKKSKVKHLANEIVVVGQLQNAFNQRLIPELEGILGGLYTIRGYPQSTISGDNLYMGSVEYRFHLPAQLKTDPNASTKIFGKSFRWAPAQPLGQTDWDFLFRAFFDVGQTTVNQAKHFERDHLIMGIGVGLELVLWHNVFIRGDYGHGLREANGISKGNNQYYFSSTIIF